MYLVVFKKINFSYTDIHGKNRRASRTGHNIVAGIFNDLEDIISQFEYRVRGVQHLSHHSIMDLDTIIKDDQLTIKCDVNVREGYTVLFDMLTGESIPINELDPDFRIVKKKIVFQIINISADLDRVFPPLQLEFKGVKK